MSKVERKAIDFVTERKNLLMFLIISIFGLVIRVKLISFRSFDFSAFLSPWYYQIRNMGGLKALRTQVGNYGILYQFLIALFTYLPGKSIFWYKALSIFFDYILAISGAKICERISNDKGKLKPLLVYSVILFSPTVIFNSCAWGQCDSIYVSFICLSLLSMLYNKNRLSFILLGIAFAFKLQTIFILPFYLLAYLKNKDFSICDIMLSFVSFYCCGLPGVIMRHDLLAPFKPFLEQTNTYNRIINLCYPNFSGLLYHGLPTDIGAYKILSSFFIFLTIGVIVIGSFYLMSGV